MGVQRVLIHGRDQVTNTPKPLAYNRGALDVFIQDQNTPIVNWILSRELATINLANHTTVDSRLITLQAGHGTSAGEIITMHDGGADYYQGIVINVNVNVITLDTPLDKVYRSDRTTITRGSANAAVDGSVTRAIFRILAPPKAILDLTQLIVYIVDDAAMDDTTLGGIASVTNGMVLRKKNVVYRNIGNAKRNGDFKVQGCSVLYAEKVGGGEFSMQAICKFRVDAGVTVRVDGTKNEEVELIIQDNLAAITSITAIVIGHIVE